MKRTFALLIALALPCSGEVFIYKSKDTVTRYGAGTTAKEKRGGFSLLDSVSGEAADIVTYSRNGVNYFSVVRLQNFSTDQVLGGTKNYTLIYKADVSEDNGKQRVQTAISKGANSAIFLGSQSWNMPKVFTLKALAVYPSNDQTMLEEWTGTSTYDKKRSEDYAFNGFDFEQVIEQIRLELMFDYTEE